MISNPNYITLVDCCDRMNMVLQVLQTTLCRIEPGDRFEFECEMLVADLLLMENQHILNQMKDEVKDLRNAAQNTQTLTFEDLDGDD